MQLPEPLKITILGEKTQNLHPSKLQLGFGFLKLVLSLKVTIFLSRR
jgi:hypothetical protein